MITPCRTTLTPARPAGIAASTRRVRRWAEPPAWLTPAERHRAAQMRDRDARDAWLTARLAAKRLIASRLPGAHAVAGTSGLEAIDICSRDAAGRGVRPRVFVGGREAAITVSIAHAGERVLVAVDPAAAPLGVDVTPVTAFSRPAARWWLTTAERFDARGLSADAAVAHAAVVWSVKEAVYKACFVDEPFQPQAIEVRVRHGRIERCTAAGRTVPPAAIRTWRLAGHALALVHDSGRDGVEG